MINKNEISVGQTLYLQWVMIDLDEYMPCYKEVVVRHIDSPSCGKNSILVDHPCVGRWGGKGYQVSKEFLEDLYNNRMEAMKGAIAEAAEKTKERKEKEIEKLVREMEQTRKKFHEKLKELDEIDVSTDVKKWGDYNQ